MQQKFILLPSWRVKGPRPGVSRARAPSERAKEDLSQTFLLSSQSSAQHPALASATPSLKLWGFSGQSRRSPKAKGV